MRKDTVEEVYVLCDLPSLSSFERTVFIERSDEFVNLLIITAYFHDYWIFSLI